MKFTEELYIKERKNKSFCCKTADEHPGGV